MLPIAPSARLGRTEISVMKVRPAETWKGEEWCLTEAEPVEEEGKVIAFVFCFSIPESIRKRLC